MVDPQTTTVEVDIALLERLRERRPGISDRELVESMVSIALGREALRRVQDCSALSKEEAIALGVEAVHEPRQSPSKETSVKAILERAGGKRMSPEEFDKHFGHLPTDGEG
jgi:hypothetical protein